MSDKDPIIYKIDKWLDSWMPMIRMPNGMRFHLHDYIFRGPGWIVFRIKHGFWGFDTWNLGDYAFGRWLYPRLKYFSEHIYSMPGVHGSPQPHVFTDEEWQSIVNRGDVHEYGGYLTADEWKRILDELVWWAYALREGWDWDEDKYGTENISYSQVSEEFQERMKKCSYLWAEWHRGIWN